MHDIAYIAGFFDGEGTISITKTNEKRTKRKRPAYGLQVSVTQLTLEPLDLIMDIFGGRIRPYRTPQGKPAHRWQAMSKQAGDFLEAIKPFARCKLEEIEIALEFRKTIITDFPIGQRPPLEDNVIEIRDGLKQKLIDVRNKKRSIA